MTEGILFEGFVVYTGKKEFLRLHRGGCGRKNRVLARPVFDITWKIGNGYVILIPDVQWDESMRRYLP